MQTQLSRQLSRLREIKTGRRARVAAGGAPDRRIAGSPDDRRVLTASTNDGVPESISARSRRVVCLFRGFAGGAGRELLVLELRADGKNLREETH